MNQNYRNNDKSTENERRIDHLVDIVEKKTRTERHLEQYSDISSPDNIENARKIQDSRDNEIKNLKNIIVNGENSNNNYLENTEKRFRYTEGYLNHNAEHMDDKSFNNAKEKQEHRKEQMDALNKNNS